MTDGAPVRDPMLGRTLGHYRIVEKIGSGGMGEVYLAHDERLERDVALKILHTGALADEAARRPFRKEALALSRLNHPNIATVHDFDTQDGVAFLVMECVAGETLSEKAPFWSFVGKGGRAPGSSAGGGPRGGPRTEDHPPGSEAGQRASDP